MSGVKKAAAPTRFMRQSRLEALAQEDGVNSLKFNLVEKKLLALPGRITVKNVWHYIVDLGPPDT